MRAQAERWHRKTGRRFPLAKARQIQENRKMDVNRVRTRNLLTDNGWEGDGRRLHDVFHLANMTFLR